MQGTPITLIGNATEDPELRFTPSGAAVASFSVAVNSRVKDGDGWKDGEPSYFRVNVWREQAEQVADSITKGLRVLVIGRIRQRKWEDKDGNPRSTFEVEADEVGPSLRWATAKVERVRSGGSGSKPASGGTWDEPPPF